MLRGDTLRQPGLVQDHVQRARAHQEPHVERGAGAEPFHQEHFHHFPHTLTEKQKQNKVRGVFIKTRYSSCSCHKYKHQTLLTVLQFIQDSGLLGPLLKKTGKQVFKNLNGRI